MYTSGIDLAALRYLAVAAELGNFGRAAKTLGVPTSTVSRNVAKTEDLLGVTLFERGHFGVRLTTAGRAVMVQVRRVLADLEAVKIAGHCSGSGKIGQIHLGVRMPPMGRPLQLLLGEWRAQHPDVGLTVHEKNERDILIALEERSVDVALMTKHALWPHAVSEPIYSERILAALPDTHGLAAQGEVTWTQLREETVLVQGWDESQTAREFYTSFMGSGVRYQTHAASIQTIMALIGAQFGVTLVSQSQAEVRFPGVVFRPIAEENAWLHIELAWLPQNEEPAVGRFVAFMRDEARSRGLIGR